MAFDERQAELILSQAFAFFPSEVVCLDLLLKGLAQIGDNWYRGKATVQQEHFASALAIRRMEALLASTPAPTRPGRILVGCPPEEEHTFVPLLLSLLLRRRGWEVVYLGANIPVRSMETTISAMRPNLVILTAQQLYTAASLLEMAEVLFSERTPLAFGGLIFTQVHDLHLSIPGYYLGNRLDKATTMVEQVMASLRPLPAQRGISYDYKTAVDYFRTRQSLLEADVWLRMESHMAARHLAMANLNFSRNIIAALALGDMGYLNTDIDWVEGLLVNHYEMPAGVLRAYLEAYYAAARTLLDKDGDLVIDWLSRLLGHNTPVAIKGNHSA